MSEWLTVQQVAERLGVAEKRAANILSEHGIRSVRLYPAAAVDTIERPGQGARIDLWKGTPMYTARSNGETYNFRSIDALARRLGGTSWQASHSAEFDPVTVEVMILAKAYKNGGARNIVATVWVPAEAVASASDGTG